MTAVCQASSTVLSSDSDAVTHYVFRHYPFLFTETESLAWLTVSVEARATAYGPPTADFLRKTYVSSEPEVLHLLADGAAAFRARVRDRIIAEHADKVHLNRCPKCRSLARTPEACLCPSCNHTWYEVRRKGKD